MTTALPPFVPPSPGAWELERTHATRPVSRFMAAIFPEAMRRGFADGTREYGALLDCIEPAMINGFMYTTPRPVGAPKGAKGPPPRPVFWLLQRLHPELRRRNRRAGEAFAERYWRKELDWWDTAVKPELLVDARALLADDPSTLSDSELSAHVRRAASFMDKSIYYHHRLNCCALLPCADFVAHVTRWTGETPEAVLVALRGRSPLSAGASAELAALRTAILDDGEAQQMIASGGAATEVLAGLATRPRVAGPLRTYLDTVGWRVMGGYDVADRAGREHPELLLKIITAAVRTTPGVTVDGGAAIAALRAKVPSAHQAEFDALLAEAEITYRVRDERNFCSDAMGTGLARRAILAAGERLVARGLVADPSHLVDATPEEIVALLSGHGGPSKDELAGRAAFRETTSLDAAPAWLGNPPSAPPPAEWLSTAGAIRMQRAIDVALQLMFSVPAKQEGQGQQLKGFGVSPGVTEGPARVILDISQLPEVREGEILVTTSTGPTFNVILPLLAGLVTERGGALSHAAIVAREYGIPGIVGCREVTTRVKTGARVKVDGSKGEMWILG